MAFLLLSPLIMIPGGSAAPVAVIFPRHCGDFSCVWAFTPTSAHQSDQIKMHLLKGTIEATTRSACKSIGQPLCKKFERSPSNSCSITTMKGRIKVARARISRRVWPLRLCLNYLSYRIYKRGARQPRPHCVMRARFAPPFSDIVCLLGYDVE